MHLKKQRNVIAEIDGKASFVFILPNSFNTLSDQFFKEINTISSAPDENFPEMTNRKKKATNLP